jgi:hypothetical protein
MFDRRSGGEWVVLLKETAPRTERMALLFNPAIAPRSNPSSRLFKLPHHPVPFRQVPPRVYAKDEIEGDIAE